MRPSHFGLLSSSETFLLKGLQITGTLLFSLEPRMTTHPSIEESIRARRERLARETVELKRDELQEENDRLRKELERSGSQKTKTRSF